MKKSQAIICMVATVLFSTPVESQTPSPYRWQLVDTDGIGRLVVENASNIAIGLSCFGSSSPLSFSIRIPSTFSLKKEEGLITIESNIESEVRDLIKTKLPKDQLKFHVDPTDLNSPLKTTYNKTRFVVFRDPSISDEATDVYSVDLSKIYQGLTLLNILRDTVTDLVITADFGEDNVGQTRITSAGSTQLSKTFNTQYCGI
jgi:hypothetical protein